MIKKIIFFDDIRLYKECELQAERQGMVGAEDFIMQSVLNFFQKKYPEKNYKKNMELWLDCEKEKLALGNDFTIADFIEGVNRQAVYGNAPAEQLQETGLTPRKASVWRKIGDAIALPKG